MAEYYKSDEFCYDRPYPCEEHEAEYVDIDSYKELESLLDDYLEQLNDCMSALVEGD